MDPEWSQQNYKIWQDSMRALVNDLGQLMSHQVGSDVKLLCKDNVIVNAHKTILAARSPVFSAMFQTDMKEVKESEVEIKDAQGQLISSESVKSLLKWMYTGEVDSKEPGVSWLEMLKMANFYQLDQLRRECQGILEKELNGENAIDILVEADMLGANSLKETAIQYINKNRSITQTEEFETRVNRKLFAEIYLATEIKVEESTMANTMNRYRSLNTQSRLASRSFGHTNAPSYRDSDYVTPHSPHPIYDDDYPHMQWSHPSYF